MRDMLALKAIESVGRNLGAACANSQDKEGQGTGGLRRQPLRHGDERGQPLL